MPPVLRKLNHNKQLASKTVDICEQRNTVFISVFNPSDVFDSQISMEGKSINKLLMTKVDYNGLSWKVAKIIKNLNLDNSTGSNKIGNLLLRNIADKISKSPRIIFQTAINKRIYLPLRRMSQIFLFFKDRSKTDISCYTPFRPLRCVSKVFGKNFHDAIYNHVKERLHPKQFSFRKKRFAVVQLLFYLFKVF